MTPISLPVHPRNLPPSSLADAGADQWPRPAGLTREAGPRRGAPAATAGERDFSADELEFLQAMQDYKQRSGRMFPTWSEVLEVLLALGYEKPSTEA